MLNYNTKRHLFFWGMFALIIAPIFEGMAAQWSHLSPNSVNVPLYIGLVLLMAYSIGSTFLIVLNKRLFPVELGFLIQQYGILIFISSGIGQLLYSNLSSELPPMFMSLLLGNAVYILLGFIPWKDIPSPYLNWGVALGTNAIVNLFSLFYISRYLL